MVARAALMMMAVFHVGLLLDEVSVDITRAISGKGMGMLGCDVEMIDVKF